MKKMKSPMLALALSFGLAACAWATPSEGVLTAEPQADIFPVQTICAGPIGLAKGPDGGWFEVFKCANGVLMLRPTKVAEGPKPPEAVE